MASWQFLVVGSLGAVGAALAAGTLAALVRYHRTGRFPDAENDPAPVTTGRLAGLWVRVVLGLGVAVYAVVSLADADLI